MQMNFNFPWANIRILHPPESSLKFLPSKYTVQFILEELFLFIEKRLNQISNEEPIDKPLNKSIKRNEEFYLFNLLRTLHGFCETCLPNVLNVFLDWYEQQQKVSLSEIGEVRDRAIKRTLAASYFFCTVLIEILPQVHFHPGDCDVQINSIIDTSFKQISYKDPAVFGMNYNDSLIVSEIFAELIGVLSQSNSKQIQKVFLDHLKELRKDAPNSFTTRAVICLLMGMKFFRIKTNHVTEFEEGISFLEEIGSYYLEVELKQKDLKHGLAGLLVEILLPLAAQIKTEANIPALITFVDKLYGRTYDLVNKKQHKMAAYPLLTCLLCVSQNKFFLTTWVQFLNLTLANLKNKDPKISRMALESLYRLIWVYIMRISCEGNTATRSRLESICGSLFPRGSRNVIPKDAPLNIFVKIIHFIAQYKIDFAFKEIIFDLLGCSRVSRTLPIYPERMNIGLRALISIFDSLQQKENHQAILRPYVPPVTGTLHRVKRTFLTKPLTLEMVQSLGLEQYYLTCRKAFDSILRTLDTQIGRPFMLTAPYMRGKEYSDVISDEMKPKLDLFRTCIAAIPRFLPDPMTHHDLIEFLTRICVHVDEEIRTTAYQSLQNMMTECKEWREDLIHIFLRFFTGQIQDTFPTLVETLVSLLHQLLTLWTSCSLLECQTPYGEGLKPINTDTAPIENGAKIQQNNFFSKSLMTSLSTNSSSLNQNDSLIVRSMSASSNISTIAFALHNVEGLALALLCQLRPQIKKIALSILNEVKQLLELLTPNQHDASVIEVLEETTPYVLDKYIQHVSISQKNKWTLSFSAICDILANLETDSNLVNVDKGNEYLRWDPWACALSGYCEYNLLPSKCPIAISFAWPAILIRFIHCNQYVDPINPQNESRGSLLRSSKSKSTSWTLCGDILNHEHYLSLWQRYLVMTFALCQSSSSILPNSVIPFRSFSPSLTTDPSDLNRSMISSVRMTRTNSLNVSQLLQKASLMVRWEATDMCDSVALGIGSVNPELFDHLLDEFNAKGILRELQDRKNESNQRRRKRKDILRLQILRILDIAVFRGLLRHTALSDRHSGTLSMLIEFIDSFRVYVETDSLIYDRNISRSMRIHFSKLVARIIYDIPLDLRNNFFSTQLKRSLFLLFHSWCNRIITVQNDRKKENEIGICVERWAIEAMCALSCVGTFFEPRSLFNEDDYVYRWLEALLASNNLMIETSIETTLCTILHLNEQNSQFFEKILQLCYIKSEPINLRCFRAISMLFSQREFPCEYIPLLCLCGTFASDSESTSTRQIALLFIQILRKQFLDESFSPLNQSALLEKGNGVDASKLLETIDNEIRFPRTQRLISYQLSKQYTQLTMPIFSEMCLRMEYARSNRQSSMLTFLLEWLNNLTLMDQMSEMGSRNENGYIDSAWGSEEATQLLLNNLFYLTYKFSNEHIQEVANLWKCLVVSSSSNLPVIMHFLFVMITLSVNTILPLAVKICTYILEVAGDRLVPLLINQLRNVEKPFKHQLCRSEMAPFYRWETNVHEIISDSDKQNVGKEAYGSEENVASNNLPLGRPKQLPMPSYGGHYSRLSTLLPQSSQKVSIFSMSDLALFLLSNLVGLESACPVDWELYIPKLIHMAIVNLDSTRPITCFHSRQTIVNICLMFASKEISSAQMSVTLLRNQLMYESMDVYGEEAPINVTKNQQLNDSNSIKSANAAVESPQNNINANHVLVEKLFSGNGMFSSRTELIKAILFALSQRQYSQMWDHEATTRKCWRSESSFMVASFVHHITNYLEFFLPKLAVDWTEFAIQCALSMQNHHLAGRSFQIIGALRQNPTQFFQPLLSHLVEIVGDSNDETQTHLADMFVCLQNLVLGMNYSRNSSSIISGHCRSISYSPNFLKEQLPSLYSVDLKLELVLQRVQKKEMRHSLLIGNEILSPPLSSKNMITRSRSAMTLKLPENPSILLTDVELNALSQLFLLGIAIMESSLDNEYLLGLHMIEKVLYVYGIEFAKLLDKICDLLKKDLNEFSGIVALASRGALLFPNGYECTLSIFLKCVPLLGQQVVAPNEDDCFALIVIASLPYCIQHFNSPTQLSIGLAQAISTYCQSKIENRNSKIISSDDDPLSNLNMMMIQFRECTFPRDKTQWTKCVVSYLLDSIKPNDFKLILFLTDMLERSPVSFHSIIFDVLHLMFSHGNLLSSPPVLFNAQIIRVLCKHIHGQNSSEASQILKIIVDQWDSIAVDSVSPDEKCFVERRKPDFEFKFEKCLLKDVPIAKMNNEGTSKSKVRDKLIKLLSHSCMGIVSPKHLLIFSQSSAELQQREQEMTIHSQHKTSQECQDLLSAKNKDEYGPERISSPNSLGPVIGHSGTNSADLISLRTTDSFPRVFKEFDFLEAEHDSISESADSCFNWLSTMRTPRVYADENEGKEEQADQEDELADDDDYYNDDEDDAEEEEEEELESDFVPNKVCEKFSAPTLGKRQHSTGSSKGSSKLTRRRKRDGPLRPLSRASDSNDVLSSDRTPIQSVRHSEESSPPSSQSENEDHIVEGHDGQRNLEIPLRDNEKRSTPSKDISNSKQKKKTLTHSSPASTSAHSSPLLRTTNFAVDKSVLSGRLLVGTASSSATFLSQQPSSTTTTTQFNRPLSPPLNPVSRSNSLNIDSQNQIAKMPSLLQGNQSELLIIECNFHITGLAEQAWSQQIARLGSDQDGEFTSFSTMLFTQLLRESATRVSGLLNDVFHLLTSRTSHPQLSSKGDINMQLCHFISQMLKMVDGVMDCPFLFVTAQFLRSSNLLTVQKFFLFELREHFDTFAERREHVLRALNAVKSLLKLLLINNEAANDNNQSDNTGGANTARHLPQQFYPGSQILALCKSLHKLCFQLLLMLDKFMEMVHAVQQSANSQESDLTPAVASLQRELLSHLSTSSFDSCTSKLNTFTSLSSVCADIDLGQSRDTLVLHTTNRQFRNAFNKLQQLRSQYCNNIAAHFGCCQQTDIDVLLLNFCRSHISLRMWALVGSLEQLRSCCTQLRETNVKLGILLRSEEFE